jgi:RNA polymerase sigma-70 factor (ECF subfamily)
VNLALAETPVAAASGLATGPRSAEQECIRRAQRGDISAYEELVRAHQRRVMAIVAGILRLGGDVEDIAQQVFLKVYLALHRFDGRSSFSTWLYKIAVNETYDYLRRKKARKLVYESDLNEEQERRMGRLTPEVPGPATLERMEARQTVDRLLAELNPEERLMIVLKEVEGYSVGEISEAMGMNANTVKVRMFRARRRLADQYRRRYARRGKASAPRVGRS